MTVRIGRLSTHCRLPRGQEAAGVLLDDAVCTILPRALSARLGPSLDRHPAICRLKALEVVLRIDMEDLRRGRLTDAWAGVLAQALHEALARPAGDGAWHRSYATRAAYFAALIADLLSGRAIPAWAAPELADRRDRPAAIVVLDLLLVAGADLPDLLHALREQQLLDPALALMDEVGLERVLRALAAEGTSAALSADQVTAVASVLAARAVPPLADAAGSRRQSFGVWLDLGRNLPPRGVWFALRLLLELLRKPALLADTAARLPDLPDWCTEVCREVARALPPRMADALGRLRPLTPGAPDPRAAQEQWLTTDNAGVLLLCSTLQRLGWSRLLRADGHDPRVVQALNGAAAMRLLRPAWVPGDSIDPAAALLAGMTEEVDRIGFAKLFAGEPPCLPDIHVADWPALIEAAADALAAAFAALVRGFRKAGRQSIARSFLRRPGRVMISPDALRVVLEPSPWSVVLHISGMDDPLEELDWIGNRRVSFVLEGL